MTHYAGMFSNPLPTVTLTESYPTTPDVAEFLSEYQYRVYDTLLAATLSICTLVGLPGNVVSLIYYYSSKRKDFSSFIYILVCSIDICICLIHLPVMMALYTNRKPGIFSQRLFCVGWNVAFYYLQQASMFLVMLMSVARSIKLVFIHYRIRTNWLLIAFLVFTGSIIVRFLLVLFFGGDLFYDYYIADAYCIYSAYVMPFSFIDQLVHSFYIGIPPILVVVSLSISIISLCQKKSASVSRIDQKKYRAAVTMTIFSALFLICNLPCLLNNILWFLTELMYKYPEPFYVGDFMFFYSWLISDVICTVLNASLNPVLYLSRILGLKQWFKLKVRRRRRALRRSFRSLRLSVLSAMSSNREAEIESPV